MTNMHWKAGVLLGILVLINGVALAMDMQRYCRCFTGAQWHTFQYTKEECFAQVMSPEFPTEPNNEEIDICLGEEKDGDDRCKLVRLYYLKTLFIDDLEAFGDVGRHTTLENKRKDYDYLSALMARHPYLKDVCTEQQNNFIYVVKFLSQLNYQPGNEWYGIPMADTLYKVFDSEGFQSEMQRICLQSFKDSFCQESSMVRRIVDRSKIVKAEASRLGWDNEEFERFLNAYRMNFVPLKVYDPEKYRDLNPQSADVMERLVSRHMNLIFDLTHAGELNQLNKLFEILPSIQEIKGCDTGSLTTWCLFRTVLDQVKQFVLKIQPKEASLSDIAKKPRKIISTNIDYKELLTQRQTEQILRIAQDQTFNIINIAKNLETEFNKTVGKRFAELKNYFIKLETFNQEKADADVAYIQGMIEHYNGSVVDLTEEVGSNLYEILKRAVGAAAGQLAEKTAKFAIAVAEACNPFKTVLNGGTFSDIMEATAELSGAIAQVIKADAFLRAFDDLKSETERIAKGFAENQEFLSAVGKLIPKKDQIETDEEFEESKDIFLQNYSAYSPTITAPEITGMVAYWEEVIDGACDLIEDTDAISAGAVESEMASTGICWRTKIKIQKMIETFTEIFEFQFEFIETMATYMQAKTGVQAAKDISKDYDKLANMNPTSDETINQISNLAFVTYMTYEVQKWQTVISYCDVLEYQNGGKRPTLCKGKSTDIPLLLSQKLVRCSSLTHAYVDIPVKERKSTTGKYGPNGKGTKKTGEIKHEVNHAVLSLGDLYSGTETTFQVPEHHIRWLASQGWLSGDDKNSAIFVAGFELYLPSSGKKARHIMVQTQVASKNTFPGKNVDYIVTPPRSFIYEYKEGLGANLVCYLDRINNPYSICHRNVLPKICPLSKPPAEGDRVITYPSILSQFDIQVFGYESSDVPEPMTDMTIKAGLALCKVQTKKTKKKKRGGSRVKREIVDYSWGCCRANNYWNVERSRCWKCPESSSPKLAGYFCDKSG